MFTLKLRSLDKILFEGDISQARLPGNHGQLCVLPGHAPLILSLHDGFVWWKEPQGNEECFFISGGVADITPHQVELITLSPQRHDDMDMNYLESIKTLLFQTLSQETQPLSVRRIKRQLDLTQKKLQAFKDYKPQL